MSLNVRDLLNAFMHSNSFIEAREYLSSNVEIVSKKLSSVSEPYQDLAKKNAQVARSFVTEKVREVRSADSLTRAVEIIVGVVMAVLKLVLEALQKVREFLIAEYRTKYSAARVTVSGFVEDVKTRAVELPQTPVGKKVEEVSRKVLGETRHDQAVDFIKAKVIPHVYKVVPSSAKRAVEETSEASFSPSSELLSEKQANRRK